MAETQIVRTPVSKRLRFEVFKRDGFQCLYCGGHPPEVLLECDHIEPVSLGGLTEIDNLVTACQPCNRGKSNVPLAEIPQSLAARAAETIEREAQIAGYQDVMKQRRLRIEADAQEVAESFCAHFTGVKTYGGVSTKDFTTIKHFVDKLGLDACLNGAERAISKQPYSFFQAFKYFCGICWGKIREAE